MHISFGRMLRDDKGAVLMCGVLFAQNVPGLSAAGFAEALQKQSWRGPDKQNIEALEDGLFLGHVRLSIIDPVERSSQPFTSTDGRFRILFNGEIYNHETLRNDLNLKCRTKSDTETIVEGFNSVGPKIFDMLDGMFAIIIFDSKTGDIWSVRDRYGIKPLYMYRRSGALIFSSECISIRELVECTVDPESLDEWRLLRQPMRGKSFFREIDNVLPGTVMKNGIVRFELEGFSRSGVPFDQKTLEDIVSQSVAAHELSDVENVALLSGGVDSSLITALSSCKAVYTVGTNTNNEFAAARETAALLNRSITEVRLENDDLETALRELTRLKGEPLYVPNEALIYSVCRNMKPEQKVVLTGEGADEVFFGYDRIFRWAVGQARIDLREFLSLYGYASVDYMTPRLKTDLEELLADQTPIEFVEDFFFLYHLPTLLRRMDFASMAASKEARVPFVSRALIEFMYRVDPRVRLDDEASKKPLRKILRDLGLAGVLERKKIGFSATPVAGMTRLEEYKRFQDINLELLGW